MKRVFLWAVGGALAALAVGAAVVAWLDAADAPPSAQPRPVATDEATIARGRYLARAGNCATCHTRRGEPPYAGGEALRTPFGTVYGGNLTPHDTTGLGRWSTDDFWRALHHGRSRDGRMLTPVFPYPHFTQVTREDSDALFAFLRSVPAVDRPSTPNALAFPYNTQLALKVWRALYFRPGTFVVQPAKSAEWNRGAYLVHGLGHCAACHGTRNAMGATMPDRAFDGGVVPGQGWYAPALTLAAEGSVAAWPVADVVGLLRDGVAAGTGATVVGPMAEVVARSTQHLGAADAQAMAVFLRDLPVRPAADTPRVRPPDARTLDRGAKVYTDQCATCHGGRGEGQPGAFPALAGNRAVTMADPTNLMRVILQGGYGPSTAGRPRPHGMPPFGHVLDDADIAAVSTHVRTAWGNTGTPVNQVQVVQLREGRD
jgi:mono/diheme cytochrome c family protein